MGKRASPAVIGAFVVGAVILAVIAVVTFGSGRFFRTTYSYVLYFTGDVNGLNAGAPVKFKGVPVGSVKQILLNAGTMRQIEQATIEPRIPVIIELDAERVSGMGAKLKPDPQTIQRLVDLGMRAQLGMESFVTGLLYVKLDMYPGSELRLVTDPSVKYPEIPTLPTPLEEAQTKAARFLAKLSDYDVRALLDSLSGTASGLDRLVNAPELHETLAGLPPLVRKLDGAVGELQTTIASVRKLSNDVNARTEPLTANLNTASQNASEALAAAKVTLERLTAFLQPDAPVPYQINESLADVSAAARALRSLAEELERNPSALIRGKATSEEKP
jgi:paraquat-inducible protein B